MNFLRRWVFARGLQLLHSKLQPPHIVHVLGVMRIIRPERNVKGVISHGEGKEEEGRQEEGQEGEEEEVICSPLPSHAAMAEQSAINILAAVPDAQASQRCRGQVFLGLPFGAGRARRRTITAHIFRSRRPPAPQVLTLY
jgi:hypothetical protein